MRGIVISVGYDDLLSVTLRKNARHLTDILVITSPDDKKTAEVVKGVPSARLYVTNAFTRRGERFNKGAAMEEGFDAFGRDGWTLIWDADILLPERMVLGDLDPTRLYGAKRRLQDEGAPLPEREWSTLPLSAETGWPGYFQLFHGSCPDLRVRPWYGVESPHAGWGDALFQNHWPTERKGWLPFEVLHLGPRDMNWFGRASPRLDGGETPLTPKEADALFRADGWRK